MTLRAAECLGRADLVVYDGLVNPAIVESRPPSARATCLAHRNSDGTLERAPTEQGSALVIEAARNGQTVVYLKGGDPEVFGHTAEETEALAAAGIPFEIVPGVTAATAASAYAEIPITHGQHASSVALVTGREQRDKLGAPLDYRALAGFPGTLVFYMGESSAEVWSQALIEGGKPPQTPVAIVRRCTWPDQETIRCTLATVADVVAQRGARPPMVIVVGEVVGLARDVSWFTGRPLSGKTILLTRPREQVAGMQRRLEELGAEVLVQPAIRIGEPADWAPVDAALGRLNHYDWLVFSSVNGVRYLLNRLLCLGGDLRQLAASKLAVIGPATADELRRYHLRADLVPRQYCAEALAEALAGDARTRRFLLVRASRGRELLAEQLAAAGGEVDQIVAYRSVDEQKPRPEVSAAMAAGQLDWTTVTSSAIARSLVALFGEGLQKTRLASISPITSAALKELGLEPAIEATEYTTDGLVDAMMARG